MTTQQAFVLVLVCGMLVACRENQVVDPNLAPNADAKIVHPEDDELVDSVELPFEGDSVTLELDGSGSTDDDGEIVEYRWLSSNTQEDGMGRGEPEPAESDTAKTEVTLEEEGLYHFSLWVKDDDGAYSTPSTVAITFGEPPEMDAAGGDEDGGTADSGGGGECTPFDGIPEACQECTCNMCPEQTSTCDEMCWGLINCVATECNGDASDMACIVSACAAFLSNADSIAAAMATGDCARECTDECSM